MFLSKVYSLLTILFSICRLKNVRNGVDLLHIYQNGMDSEGPWITQKQHQVRGLSPVPNYVHGAQDQVDATMVTAQPEFLTGILFIKYVNINLVANDLLRCASICVLDLHVHFFNYCRTSIIHYIKFSLISD